MVRGTFRGGKNVHSFPCSVVFTPTSRSGLKSTLEPLSVRLPPRSVVFCFTPNIPCCVHTVNPLLHITVHILLSSLFQRSCQCPRVRLIAFFPAVSLSVSALFPDICFRPEPRENSHIIKKLSVNHEI